MFILDLSGNAPSVADRESKREIARSMMEFFRILKEVQDINPSDASWCGMCMAYLIAYDCFRSGDGINCTSLSKRGDAVGFPFTNGIALQAFQDGMQMGENVLLETRKFGEEQALQTLGKRLAW